MALSRAADGGDNIGHRPPGMSAPPTVWQRQRVQLVEGPFQVGLLNNVLRPHLLGPQLAPPNPTTDRFWVAPSKPRRLRHGQHVALYYNNPLTAVSPTAPQTPAEEG